MAALDVCILETCHSVLRERPAQSRAGTTRPSDAMSHAGVA
jgi:hypothetical protein